MLLAYVCIEKHVSLHNNNVSSYQYTSHVYLMFHFKDTKVVSILSLTILMD